jgi:chromate transporter
MPPRPSLSVIFLAALRLGCTSFGGPVAHLAYFRAEYVTRRRWLDDAHYADLVALCQFLPGPASSQVGFGVGYLVRGLPGGLVAWLGFTLPSALLMIGFGYGMMQLGNLSAAGWLHGLKAAAVAVVAQAVWLMARSLCPDWPRRLLALSAATLVLWLPFAWTQIAVIAVGAVLGWSLFQGRSRTAVEPQPDAGNQGRTPTRVDPAGRGGGLFLISFFLLLLALPVLADAIRNPLLEIFDRFYRTGALVFGGGHVVLPLLEREVVAPGWVTHDEFLAGYGAVQAMPGPLFTLSAYLGTAMRHGPGGVVGGLWALLAIFLPALLLVAGALPFWRTLRHQAAAQAALRGANATVVGVLLAALWNPVGTAGLTSVATGGIAVVAWAALQFGKIPAWAVVLGAAALGALVA